MDERMDERMDYLCAYLEEFFEDYVIIAESGDEEFMVTKGSASTLIGLCEIGKQKIKQEVESDL